MARSRSAPTGSNDVTRASSGAPGRRDGCPAAETPRRDPRSWDRLLGLLALQRGYKVRFTTLAAAIADLMRQESLPALERRLKRYTQVDLLILEEIGYLPCDAKAADLLFNIISRRHEKRSTVISTNLAYKQ